MPPSVAKIGRPSSAAARMTPIPAASIAALCGAGKNPNTQRDGTIRAPPTACRGGCGAACHTMPSATARKPAGMADWATQRGMPAARLPPPSRSALTNMAAAQARHMAMAAPTAETKMRTLRGPSRREKSVGGKRQKPVGPRGQGRPDEGDPERQVLHDNGRSRDARQPPLPRNHLGDGEQRHRREGRRRNQAFERVPDADVSRMAGRRALLASALIFGLPRRTRGIRRGAFGPRRTGRRESSRLAASDKRLPRLCATPPRSRRRRE